MISKYIQDKILMLDVEFGNASGFYSGHKTGFIGENSHISSIMRDFVGFIDNQRMQIKEVYALENQEISRALSFIPDENFKLFDFVSRFVIWSNDRPAYIADRVIPHHNKNIYHQHPAKELVVPVGDEQWLKFTDIGSTYAENFENVFYARDEATEIDGRKRWIVHHRIIVKQAQANLVVRGCNPRFEGPLPAQWLIPHVLKRKLFRIREQTYPNFPLMSVGEATVTSGYVTTIRTRVEIVHEWPAQK